MVHFYSVYIPEPAEKYIHILKGCLEKNVSSYFIFCKDLFVVIHLNAMGLRPLTEGQKCVWSLWEENFPVCPQLASETGTAGSAVTLRSHSPHHTWNDMAGLTLHSSVWLAWFVCVTAHTVDLHFTSISAAAFFCFASVNKRRPSPSPRGHKWAVPAVRPAFPLSCLAELSCLSSWWIFTSSLRFFSQPLLFLSFCLILLFHHLALDKSFISYNLPLFCEME